MNFIRDNKWKISQPVVSRASLTYTSTKIGINMLALEGCSPLIITQYIYLSTYLYENYIILFTFTPSNMCFPVIMQLRRGKPAA